MTRIVTEDEVRALLGYDRAAFDRVEAAYLWPRDRRVSMPPVFHIDIDPQSAVDIKGAFVEGLPVFAIKMASGFYDNPRKGLPSSSSVILAISGETGLCEAVLLDNGHIMNVRTALAGAVATHHLAGPDMSAVGIVGTGVQAREQARALTLVRKPERFLVWGRNDEKAASCAAEIERLTGVVATPVSVLETLVRQSPTIITTTQSLSPLIRADWIGPGTHITAVGSDLPGKQELDADVLREARLVVCDSVAQCRIGGELQHVAVSDLRNDPRELADVIAQEAGRQLESDITICDMTGLGLLDTAVANLVIERLSAA